jgi:hypothetical protein
MERRDWLCQSAGQRQQEDRREVPGKCHCILEDVAHGEVVQAIEYPVSGPAVRCGSCCATDRLWPLRGFPLAPPWRTGAVQFPKWPFFVTSAAVRRVAVHRAHGCV